jgi:hypothetical protein
MFALFSLSNTFYAEVLPSFGFDASAVQLPAVPQLNPVRDTAASRLASTLDNRASDDSGMLPNRSCYLNLLRLEGTAVPISLCNTESSRSRRKRARKTEKRRGSSHRSSTHDTHAAASHRSGAAGAAASHRSGAAGASLNELLGSNVPTDTHPMCVCAQASACPSFRIESYFFNSVVRSAFDSIGDSSALLYRKSDPRFVHRDAIAAAFVLILQFRAVPLYRPCRLNNKVGLASIGTLALRVNFRCV